MPELPEVETIRRGLEKCILNKKIVRIEVREQKSFTGENDKFLHNLAEKGPRKVVKLRRFGKALILDLDDESSLLIHLRMTGQLIWQGKERFAGGHPNENFVDSLPNKQTRVILEFEDGKLFFNDQRKFGFIKVMPTAEVKNDAFIKKLAKEPWQMTVTELKSRLEKHKNSSVKAVLLDQTVICGLGNIYADETLFFAGVHPNRKAGDVTEAEAEQLLIGARTVMERSLESGGSTMATYVKADGTRGNYLDNFAQVFGREGQKCCRCGEKIVKIRVAGRGTHVCPRCQK